MRTTLNDGFSAFTAMYRHTHKNTRGKVQTNSVYIPGQCTHMGSVHSVYNMGSVHPLYNMGSRHSVYKHRQYLSSSYHSLLTAGQAHSHTHRHRQIVTETERQTENDMTD